ncbi:shikimate kinase [Wenyingzhuangia sp. chi5]|uniref:Shikimate kinase n=1 Tax=Wenyingzhuangia gilva TaxID=3057677 RepID=A0ABT8VR56_9FLAO|nr:shikimate kinase [Wenyingzhuangia sp. chi5]MDO3694447.1 shikimate kinase [Wenyingzhuangia sp. chi5]
MKLVLLGYMGCGKSAISNALANSLNLKRIDLDDYIETKEGKTIADIFKENGEIYFRKLETTCLLELLDNEEAFILSLGGGTPCFGKNMEIINQKSISVYLSANIPTLVSRLLPEKAKRPLIARIADEELAEFIGKHLFERRHFYLQAKIAVSVDDKPVQTIANEIVSAL